jgi:hypothetical protein
LFHAAPVSPCGAISIEKANLSVVFDLQIGMSPGQIGDDGGRIRLEAYL